MDIERIGTRSLIDVLDRVLDKGIVVDAWMRLSVAGIDLIGLEAHIVVASIATYLQYSEKVDARTADTSGRLVGRRLPIGRGPTLSA
jgi:hypothetical protein